MESLLWWLPWVSLIASPLLFLDGRIPFLAFFGGQLLVTYAAWRISLRHAPTGTGAFVVGMFLLAALQLLTPGSDTDHSVLIFGLVLFLPLLLSAAVWGTPQAVALSALALLLVLVKTGGEITGVALYLPVIASSCGIVIARLLATSEASGRIFSQMALTDPLTGLGNRHGLARDFRRIRALAQRHEQPLLICRWTLEHGAFSDDERIWPAENSLTGFARLLEGSVREGDGVYFIGDQQFVSLHPNLVSGDLLLARVRSGFPQAAAGWTEVGDRSLEDALKEISSLSPRAPRLDNDSTAMTN